MGEIKKLWSVIVWAQKISESEFCVDEHGLPKNLNIKLEEGAQITYKWFYFYWDEMEQILLDPIDFEFCICWLTHHIKYDLELANQRYNKGYVALRIAGTIDIEALNNCVEYRIGDIDHVDEIVTLNIEEVYNNIEDLERAYIACSNRKMHLRLIK